MNWLLFDVFMEFSITICKSFTGLFNQNIWLALPFLMSKSILYLMSCIRAGLKPLQDEGSRKKV